MNWVGEIYKQRKALQDEYGVKLHVDHIVPLQGKNVCGLHVPWNMRITTASYNTSIQNKVIESDMPAYVGKNTILIHESAMPWNLRG
jgi:hypothetical protein